MEMDEKRAQLAERVERLRSIATPPWQLGVEGEAAGFEFDWMTARFPLQPRRDPNGRDGEWPEIAFMPRTAEWVTVDSAETWHWVPVYSPVGEALFAERRARAERQLVERVERAQEKWGEYWREVTSGMLRAVSVHERVACPKCGAQVGELCISMASFHGPQRTKHPHRERLRADGLAD